MNRKLPDITESATELKNRLRKEWVVYKQQRLMALYLLQSGKATNRQQVADLIGVNRKTVGHWLDAYQAGGFQTGLLPKAICDILNEIAEHREMIIHNVHIRQKKD